MFKMSCLVKFHEYFKCEKILKRETNELCDQGITSLYCNEIFSSLPLIEKQILDIPLIFGSQTPCPPLYPFIVK